MGQREGPVEAYLVAEVKRTGGEIRKVQWVGRMGAPDRLVWWTFPLLAFVELKGLGGRYEASQRREFKRLRDDGWPVYTLWSKEDVDRFISDMQRKGVDIL